MIRLEQDVVVRGGCEDELSPALVNLLERRWSGLLKAFKRCRKNFLEDSVHRLRVQIRRMQSTLALLAAIVPRRKIKPLQRDLKKRIRSLSRLRDTQVQLALIGKCLKTWTELEPFHDWLLRKERRMVRCLERELAKAHPGKARRHVARVSRFLCHAGRSAGSTSDLPDILSDAVGRAFDRVTARQRTLSPARAESIHRMRVAFKKFRYMAEALAQVRPGISHARLRSMHDFQTHMGEIQDIEVLLDRSRTFVKKKRAKKKALLPFRHELLLRRARLVKRFVESTRGIERFWPPPPTTTARRAQRPGG